MRLNNSLWCVQLGLGAFLIIPVSAVIAYVDPQYLPALLLTFTVSSLTWLGINQLLVKRFCPTPESTQPSRVEAALLESENRFRSIFERINSGIAFADSTGQVIEVNQFLADFLGYSIEAVKRMNFADFTYPADLEQEAVYFAEIAQGQRDSYRMEKRYVTRSGQIVWGDLVVSVVRNAQGVPVNFVGLVVDIDTRKQSELEYQTILQTTQDGFWIIDVLGCFLEVNDAYCRLIGYSREELLAMRIADIEANETPAEVQAHIQALMSLGSAYFETRHRRRDGKIIDIEVSTTYLAHCQSKFLVFLRDITERKQVEAALQLSNERFNLAADAARIGVWDYDLTQDRLEWSKSMYRLYQLDPTTSPISYAHWLQCVLPADRERIQHELEQILQSGAKLDSEFRIRWPTGEVRHLHALAQIQRNQQGTAQRIIGINLDISAAKQAEAAIIAAKEQAESANQAKSRFLANMSHEIRTPMNAILGLTQLVLDTDLAPLQRDNISKVYQSSKALLEILNDILDYSKIEADRLEIAHQRFSVATVIDHVTALFTPRIQQQGLSLRTQIAPDLPDAVIGDALRLTQVLNNLMDNAIKFTEQGEIMLQAQLSTQHTHGYRLEFHVHDSGIGLSEQQQAGLFQPFSQVDGSITRHYGGTGLGLAICRRLVELMGGEINVSSTPGAGTTFWFSVQVGRPTPTQLKATAAKPFSSLAELKSRAGPLAGRHILLAEDNSANQQIITELLAKFGSRVLTADNGQEAVEFAMQQSFDIILLDLSMPAMGGIEAARRILAALGQAAPPIVALTAAVLPQDRERCRQVGMADFLAKPIDTQTLVDVLLKQLAAAPVSGSPVASQANGPEVLQDNAHPDAVQTDSHLGELANSLENLLPYLKEHELVPESLFAALRRYPHTERLLERLDQFDYPHALREAEQLLDQLTRTAGPFSATSADGSDN